ncbi:glycosyltransferase [Pusillimonas sp. MFBS29]|uniref:glycosyltransferase n=1 Tax=Pusillimonas sp. MFBS29 TaxID=2886690 RepID=UPI001D112278|nr:glycosyltransferase [Pusillimonas sp. MFBS29]MCC2596135.1 glycosyltransferase [Pusillimonas sp. MFBS29]
MTTPTPSTPRVSVVIPSYNHERYLQDTMDSVLSQQGVDLELVIIDDGSRDGSWQLIQEAASRDSRVRPYAQANQGAHAAINAGLRACRGEFLAILNSDDRYQPGRLATLVALAQAGPGLDFIATGLRLINDASQPVIQAPWLDEYQRMRDTAREQGLWAALLERNFTVSTSNFFMRRSLYEALGPIRPLRYNMDWDYALRAYLQAPERFAWRDDLVLLDYRLHGSNTILGGLPVSAIEANHLLYRSLKQRYGVPGSALASLRRHYRLIRLQQVSKVAQERDTRWEAELQKAHAGWAATRDENDQVHARLGDTLTELGVARTGWGEARKDLGETRQELGLVRHELAQVLASRSYRIGRKVTAPVRWLKARLRKDEPAVASSLASSASGAVPSEALVQGAAAAAAGHPAPAYQPLALPDVVDMPAAERPRVAAHLHVHHLDLLDELLDAVGNLPTPFDLFVTTTNSLDTVQPQVLARFPGAQVWQPANQGKDVGPFVDALNRHRLDQYDLVLKLHGKKSQNHPNYLAAVRGLFGKDIRDGDDWRRKLIAPLAGSPRRVAQIYQAFANDAQLGMAGAARFICKAPDADPDAYAALCERLGVSDQILFFGGTMFWIRGAALAPFLGAGLTLDDFDDRHAASVEGTLEHGCERVFGALAAKAGGRLGGLDDLQA